MIEIPERLLKTCCEQHPMNVTYLEKGVILETPGWYVEIGPNDFAIQALVDLSRANDLEPNDPSFFSYFLADDFQDFIAIQNDIKRLLEAQK